MQPGDIIAIIAVVLIIGLATAYIIRAKKRGNKCIGCPNSGSCNRKNCGEKSDNSEEK